MIGNIHNHSLINCIWHCNRINTNKQSYRVRTEIWPWFSRLLQDKITSFFLTFQGILFVHLYVNKNITKLAFKCWNFLYNVFLYSKYQMGLKLKYQMGLKFLNSELQMLCVMNCTKINECMGNQQCHRHLCFPGQHYSFQGIFQTFPCQWSLSRLFKALKISTLNSRTFHTFPGSVHTLCMA